MLNLCNSLNRASCTVYKIFYCIITMEKPEKREEGGNVCGGSVKRDTDNAVVVDFSSSDVEVSSDV